MFKKIKVGGKEIDMLATASTSIRYKQIFHEDLISLFQATGEKGELTDYLSISQKLGYIMAQHAAKADMEKLNEDAYMEWLDQFEPFDFVEAGGDIVKLYRGNEETSAESKKKEDELSAV